MKNLFFLPLLFLSLITTAQTQTADKVLINIFKDIKPGMTLADCQKARPNTTLDETDSLYINLTEKIEKNGIKNIVYHFVKAASDKHLDEIIIEFDSKEIAGKTANTLLGRTNYTIPDGMWDAFWVVYNGKNDYPALAWEFQNKLVFQYDIPNAGMHYMFDLKNQTTPFDLRINKNGDKLPINFSAQDYLNELFSLLDNGIDFKNPVDSLYLKLPYTVTDKQKIQIAEGDSPLVFDGNHNGLEQLVVRFDKGINNYYDEINMEFENAETLKQMTETFAPFKHPRVDNCWIMGKRGILENGKYQLVIAWRSGKELTFATNLPKSKYVDNEAFKISNDEFDKLYKNE
ncbi:MAG: hypothetical protein K2X95_03640 [Flavobacteriaceae bacterium]|nr:hypothetical protein [Flavobacteriaceae bacterium]